MSEEQSTEGQEAPAEPIQESQVEVEAREHGWKPKEEFEAEDKNAGKKWRSAEDFMDRKSLFDKIDERNHEVKQLKKTVHQLGQHYTQVEKAAFQRALDTLKDQRKEALENNDLVKAEEIRDEMDEVKQKLATPTQIAPASNEPPQEFVDFKAKNTWYQRDDRMTRYADALGKELFEKGYTPREIMREVEKDVRDTFPEKFRNPNRDTAPEMVPSGKRTSGNTGFRLTEAEDKIARNFAASGIMTYDQYVADIKKLRG
jgi:hypothetical protein